MIHSFPRVRFAPSPTGYLHVGGLRTALYNFLFAKKNNGKFILRIEDTDRTRFVEGAAEKLMKTMHEVGLISDEGPDKPGEYGPYVQSERLRIYNEHVKLLKEKGQAYHCFCTPERLKELKEEQQRNKLPQAKYDKHCLHLPKDVVKDNLEKGLPFVIRLNVEPGNTISFDDMIRGKVDFSSDVVDDQILIKSDGFPTYHLANVVDDHLMKVTHVIRGEEWLSSTPKHVLLYKYFDWELPLFSHLPLLLNADKSKLSKRQGDVAVEDYLSKGYFPESLVNFVALLGWNAGDDREFYLLDELIEHFSMERVNKAGAVFNVEKLDWLQGEHMRSKSNEELLPLLKSELEESKYAGQVFSDDYLLRVIESMKERIKFVKDLLETSFYFFERPLEYDPKVVEKRWKDDSVDLLQKFSDKVNGLTSESKEEYENILKSTAEENEAGIGKLIHPIRVVLSGVGTGPGIYDLLAILGKDEVIARIKRGIEAITQI